MTNLPVWPPAPPLGGRQAEIQQLTAAAAEGRCLSLVGMSNVGKSYVLRALCQAAPAATAAFIYIDCNRMVEFSEQGLYELVLRCMNAGLPLQGELAPLGAELERCYGDVVSPSTHFLAHLRFNAGLAAACEQLDRPLVLVLDALDEIMQGIDDRVLLNLRALRDTYPQRLSYLTASRRRLGTARHARGAGEFAELFAQNTYFLAPLAGQAATAVVGQCAREGSLSLAPSDMPLLCDETGGHPALLVSVSYALSTLRQDAQATRRHLSEERVHEQLDSDAACQAECAKLWQELDQEERQALLHW
ncbi:MAG TPA: ATP-binding protein, partial [Anaerolineae bacterium]|nr:ATP-binding protein [Anaerolineae bacterium]